MSLNSREKELYEAIHAMTLADVRNELERYSLPTTGTRTSCTQRLFKYKRQQIPKESASKSNRPRRPITRQAAKAQGQAESTTVDFDVAEPSLQFVAQDNTAQSVEEQQITTNETLATNLDREYSVEEIEQRVGKRLDERLTKQLAEWQDNILHTIKEMQTIATKPPEGEISCVEEKDRLVEASTPFTDRVSGHVSEGVTQLVRKQKFVGSSIEVVMYELQRVLTGEEMHKPLSKVLERLNSLEKEYSGIVQELIAVLPSEVSVTEEVSKWAAFQQQILGITMLAEQQISIQSEIEGSKKQLSTTSHANPV